MKDTVNFAARRDTTAMSLSALDACCVCGGGAETARATGVDNLASVLWPIVVGISSQAQQTEDATSAKYSEAVLAGAVLLTERGESALVTRLLSLSNEDLAVLSLRFVDTSDAGDEILGDSAVPVDALEVLTKILPKSVDEAEPKQQQQMAPNVGILTSATLTNSRLLVMARTLNWKEHVFCFLRALWITFIVVGLYNVYTWKVIIRRVYVVLRCDNKYYGTAKDIDRWKPEKLSFTKIDQIVGFYLPCSSNHPGRLKAFSAALLADEGDVASKPTELEVSKNATFAVSA